ncbi:MalY/PatB family protein [Alkalibacillus almallahensis]|uniref:MalY/PatB family protein n=1 Tax=Alkalibacillus almallahensis TaxID=1379154 RepID=UPI0014241162|nr:PatB family C-S lyase [Alkalibacillus almallahensis]NIK12150.1 cystathionine beta-lyase [Alkalibacillus almallahensis]
MTEFNKKINRENTRAVKYEFREKLFERNDVLPMWVADMDLPAPQAIQDAIMARAEHNIYGYTTHDDELLSTIQNWLTKRYQFDVNTDLISFSPGVIPALHALVEAFTEEGDQIVIQPPVYPPFFSVVESHDRTVLENPLIYENNTYRMNFDQLEEQFKQGAKAFILCSPHNPVGRVWTESELKQLAELCVTYNVYLFSDEIHSDIIFSGHKHRPIADLNENISALTFTMMAPSKTFNIAGLQASFTISPDEDSKKVLDKQLMKQGAVMLNTIAYTAMEAAYQHGEPWLEDLIKHLENNYAYLQEQLKQTPITPVKADGTYLIWLDFSETGLDHEEIKRKLNHEAKVGLNDGQSFSKEHGDQFMRMNIACPREMVEDAVKRLVSTFG